MCACGFRFFRLSISSFVVRIFFPCKNTNNNPTLRTVVFQVDYSNSYIHVFFHTCHQIQGMVTTAAFGDINKEFWWIAHKGDPNYCHPPQSGRTPLHAAIDASQVNMVSFLVLVRTYEEVMCCVNDFLNFYQSFPACFHFSAIESNPNRSLIGFCTQNGADLYATDSSDNTPLSLAASQTCDKSISAIVTQIESGEY